MNKKASIAGLIVAISTFGVTGLVETAGAAPDESQRLRGLGDRVFQVSVELTVDPFGIFASLFGVPVGTTFPNCYIFAAEPDADGNNWFESAFPTVGTWTQYSVGATTDYVVDLGDLIQEGRITPARGKGVLQLEATTSIAGVLEFHSVGEEIFGSAIADCPEFPPPFTLPETP